MASFVQELWESIFTPGPTPTLLIATNATFAALQVLLGMMLLATYSLHFFVLSVLCGGLWWSINWFARELKVHQEQEEEKTKRAREARLPPVVAEESETEVEETTPAPVSQQPKKVPDVVQPIPTVAGSSASKDAEPTEDGGELKHRATGDSGSQDTRSGVSTEDEWEKVSENENEKDK